MHGRSKHIATGDERPDTMDETGDASDGARDSPYLAVNQERVRNHLYRAIERDDVDIAPQDVPRLDDALDTLSEAELRRFGTLARDLEAQDREGLPFLALTDTEREYFDLLETALHRLAGDEETGDLDEE